MYIISRIGGEGLFVNVSGVSLGPKFRRKVKTLTCRKRSGGIVGALYAYSSNRHFILGYSVVRAEQMSVRNGRKANVVRFPSHYVCRRIDNGQRL